MQLWFAAGRELGMFTDDTQDSPFGIPLWKAADETQGISFGNSSKSIVISYVSSPNVTITINGGDPDMEERVKRILDECFAEEVIKFQDNIQRMGFD